jgi:hypothetical protein
MLGLQCSRMDSVRVEAFIDNLGFLHKITDKLI